MQVSYYWLLITNGQHRQSETTKVVTVVVGGACDVWQFVHIIIPAIIKEPTIVMVEHRACVCGI